MVSYEKHNLHLGKHVDQTLVFRLVEIYKLESRGVPTYILRLLSSELIGQCICSLGFHSLRFFPYWEWSEARGDTFSLAF